MTKLNEQEVFNIVDNMHPDDVKEILDELPNNEMEISSEQMKRIKQKTYAKTGVVPIKQRKPRALKIVASLLLTFAIGAGAINHDVVEAKIARALSYIPGLNYVVEDEHEIYILKTPIIKEMDGAFIKIKGMTVDHEKATILMEGEGTGRTEQVFFRDQQGKEYHADNYGLGWSDQHWNGQFTYNGKIEDVTGLVVVMKDKDGMTIPVMLAKADKYSDYEEIGATDIQNGVKLTAIPTKMDEKLQINLVSTAQRDIKVNLQLSRADQAILVDNSGREYAVDLQMSDGYASLDEFYYDIGDTNEESFTLKIPFIRACYDTKAKVKLQIPKAGTVDINKTIEMAGAKFIITKIERLDKDNIRVYTESGYKRGAQENLIGVEIDGTKLPQRGYATEMDEATGTIKHYDIGIKPQMKNITLYLNSPEVELKGPWELKLNLKE